MRYIVLIILLFAFNACEGLPKEKKSQQDKFTRVDIPENLIGKDWEGNDVLVGNISLAQMRFFTKAWFDADYNRYVINQDLLKKIKPLLKKKEVILIMGTWCEDSQREVPGMIKVLDAAGYNTSAMKIIAVDEDKVSPEKTEKTYDLLNVPTLLIFENGKEINRIVEFPIQTLEEDIYAILSGEDYKNAYAE